MGLYTKQPKATKNDMMSFLKKRATFFKFALEKFGFAHIYNNMITNFSNIGENYGKENRKNQSPNLQRDWAKNEPISKRDDLIRENIKRDVAKNHGLDFVALIGWIGAILLCLSPLFDLVVWCSLAIFGLTLLTFQAYKNKVYNLLFLNIFSIITFSIKLIGQLL